MTAGEIFLNVLFFPAYLLCLPFIVLWNAVPEAFLIWAVVRDFNEKMFVELSGDK